MEREILFRGKSLDNNKWFYGNYIEKIKPTEKEPTFWTCFIQDKAISMYEVKRETVGQFSGLTDKNGAKIFEGDIVEAWSEGYKHIGEIRWRLEGQPAIIIYPAFANQGFWKIHGDKGMDNGVEVIGNIHDNPELINK